MTVPWYELDMWSAVGVVPEMDDLSAADRLEIVQLHAFLRALGTLTTGDACLTPLGLEWLGITKADARFSTLTGW